MAHGITTFSRPASQLNIRDGSRPVENEPPLRRTLDDIRRTVVVRPQRGKIRLGCERSNLNCRHAVRIINTVRVYHKQHLQRGPARQ